jgi:hypothetical protein
MEAALIIVPALISACVASFLTHAFTRQRSKKEFRLRKLEELLTKVQVVRQIRMELYELHLYHSLDRVGVKNYFDMREKVTSIYFRYNSPQNEIRSICQIYFPNLYDSANTWINRIAQFGHFDQKFCDRIGDDRNKHELSELINKTFSETNKLEEVFQKSLLETIRRYS